MYVPFFGIVFGGGGRVAPQLVQYGGILSVYRS